MQTSEPTFRVFIFFCFVGLILIAVLEGAFSFLFRIFIRRYKVVSVKELLWHMGAVLALIFSCILVLWQTGNSMLWAKSIVSLCVGLEVTWHIVKHTRLKKRLIPLE